MSINYHLMTQDALLSLARARGLYREQVPTKDELVKLLSEADNGTVQPRQIVVPQTGYITEDEARSRLRGEARAALNRSAERDAYETLLFEMTVGELDEYASEQGVSWPEKGSGKEGSVIKSDKVLVLMEAWDAKNGSESEA